MNKIFKDLKFALIVSKNLENITQEFEILKDYLLEFGIVSLTQKDFNDFKSQKDFKDLKTKTNLIISLGGDGNFIGTCRKFANFEGYIFGVHIGHLGFLTDVTLAKFKDFFSDLKKGLYKIESPNLLQADFRKNDKIISKFAFNDVVLMRKKLKSTAKIDAFLEGKYFNSYFGDGVIISSAMGSTAYNMSAGGAIIHPKTEVFSLTPICSHSLTQRPLILPKEFIIEFKSDSDILAIIDGQESWDFKNYDSIKIGISNIKINIIRHQDRDYFNILKEKLRWGHL